jgi:hypothetical protein
LDVLYGGLGKSKLQYLIEKKNSAPYFFLQNPRSGLHPDSLDIEIQQKSVSSLDSLILNLKKIQKMQKKFQA